MSENFDNKIKGLTLENFTCFSKAEMTFSSGINVFIGENGTGKTHILKYMYAITSINQHYERKSSSKNYNADIGTIIMKPDQLSYTIPLEVFAIKDLSELKRFKTDHFMFKLQMDGDLYFEYCFYSPSVLTPIFSFYEKPMSKPIFIPAHEMISTHRGFIPNYLERENDYDKTYFDLAVLLQKANLKNEPKNLLEDILSEINIDIKLEDNIFYIYSEGNKVRASLSAEGIRKIAQVIQLIRNGSIKENSILFWDEPEVNLNPKYIKIVAKFLQTLAKNGVQIFVATHDYLLAHLLSLDAEYRDQTQAPPMRFFSFYKGEDGSEIEAADTLAGLQNNVMLDEYAAYYDLEQSLFRKSMQNV